MGKTKNKTHSELEHLRGENKELRAENRSLKRRLRELEKHEHMFEEHEQSDEKPEEVNMEDTYIRCTECGKGVMKEYELMGRVYGTCTVCGERKKLR